MQGWTDIDTLIDGLQSLDEWKEFFHQPGASTLALCASTTQASSAKLTAED
jgi:hypothetical protein